MFKIGTVRTFLFLVQINNIEMDSADVNIVFSHIFSKGNINTVAGANFSNVNVRYLTV